MFKKENNMTNDQLKKQALQIIEAQDMVIEGRSTWQQIYQRTGITKEMYREMMELLNN